MAKDSSTSSFDLLYVDDFYFSAIFDDDEQHSGEVFEVSDEKYAEELQLQEALISSAMASPATPNDGSSTSASCSTPSPLVTVFVTPLTTAVEIPSEENGCESSLSFCEICVERKESEQMFKIESCLHSFCSDCTSKYVAEKLNESLNVAISCPGVDCKSFIELEACREILPRDVVERWNDALCEALILSSEKLNCPFGDCSAVLIVEDDRLSADGVIRDSECPVCHRLFCAQCRVPWHSAMECCEYQSLNDDERGREERMVRELAMERKWMRCPHCKYFVEKTEGCLHITCRCMFEFCYGCGSNWSSTHVCCQPN